MSKVMKHLGLLGREAEDRVTGFKGVVTSLAFDLYGCIQAVIQPNTDPEGKVPDGRWLDVVRINTECGRTVMACPDYSDRYEEYLELLGQEARDIVTGFEGVIATVYFKLSGRIQVHLSPRIDPEGKAREGCVFDVESIGVTSSEPVMDPPDYNEQNVADGDHGCAEKLGKSI